MLTTLRKAEYAELMILFFIQSLAMAMWFVPLGTILDAHGLRTIKPLAFAASAVAAFISPLMFGALADRHVPPAKLLRGLALATAVFITLISKALKAHANAWLILALIQVFYLAYAPMFTISTALVLARLKEDVYKRQQLRQLAGDVVDRHFLHQNPPSIQQHPLLAHPCPSGIGPHQKGPALNHLHRPKAKGLIGQGHPRLIAGRGLDGRRRW